MRNLPQKPLFLRQLFSIIRIAESIYYKSLEFVTLPVTDTRDCFYGKLWSIEEVEWFSLRNQDWIDAYAEDSPDELPLSPLTDEKYFVYGEEQHSVMIRTEYLQTALEISAEYDGAILLLNPQVLTNEGEWEAWLFANWLAGAKRYRSFWEMMQQMYQNFRNGTG